MRKRRRQRRGFGRRFVAPRRSLGRSLAQDDDPLFDEREMEFAGAGDEKVSSSDH
jgi:hypothetical protein